MGGDLGGLLRGLQDQRLLRADDALESIKIEGATQRWSRAAGMRLLQMLDDQVSSSDAHLGGTKGH